jgi:GDP-4-dehydro-6-deoxy-D-mannose reductase
VHEAHPEHVYLLAGLASVQQSFADPLGFLQHNVACLMNALEAVRTAAPSARVLVVSSSEVYGRRSHGPTAEDAELRPESPYAVSKAAQDLIGYQYFAAHTLEVVRVRPFNHIGPGQSEAFVVSSFAMQVAAIEAQLGEPVIRVGNLDAQRDFTDVRDIVRAYRLALVSGQPGEAYNVGSGLAVSIRTILDALISRSQVAVSVEVDESRLRSADPPAIVCDSTRFHSQTGWAPRILFQTTIDDVLDDWRQRIRVRVVQPRD